ncbi:MAG: BMP family ABC transporter substrate-binding protein [Clostridia bacterium]|nr:BMP family ABC transporter substrate-binding protein [Clostridia bacterium]
MQKKLISFLLSLFMMLGLMAGCSGEPEGRKIAMVTDGNAVSDEHLNHSVWRALLEYEEENKIEVNFYRPNSFNTDEYLMGVDTLVKNGYEIIILPGVIMSEAFLRACESYPNTWFIGIESDVETVPKNGTVIRFDNGQVGYLAGFAAASEHPGRSYGGVFSLDSAAENELIHSFMDGVIGADPSASVSAENFVFVGETVAYPKGQFEASKLFENGVDTLLVCSEPTGLGALAEARLRRQAGDDIWAVGTDADTFVTATYDVESDLSAVLTSALCNYGKAAIDIVMKLQEGDKTPLGTSVLFDLSSGFIGIPEENPNLSEETVEAVKAEAEKLLSGEIVLAQPKN